MSSTRLMGQVIIHHNFSHVEFGQDVIFTISTKKKVYNTFYVTVLHLRHKCTRTCIISVDMSEQDYIKMLSAK